MIAELIVIEAKEIEGINLWSNRHLLGLLVQEDLNWDNRSATLSLFLIERYKTLILSFFLTLKQASDGVEISIQQISSFMLQKENTRWQGVEIWLETSDCREFNFH